jgi:hypothetical protein
VLSGGVRKQTEQEYYGYSKDVLGSLIRSTFNMTDELVFITYQPAKQQLDHKQVTEQTYQLFGQIKYVEVIEQTFKVSKIYNSGAYIDSYHSHLIAKASDYNAIKNKLDGLGIVTKFVYDIEGLKQYLTKQAGNNYNRILPTQNIPIAVKETISETITSAVKELIRIIVFRTKLFFQLYKAQSNLFKRFITINKIERMLMYVDDT